MHANQSLPISGWAGGVSGHECLALPRRSAGEPATSCPALTFPSTAEPGSTWPPAPMLAPGMSVLRAPTAAPAPTWIAPMWTESPSIHQPDRSTSGSMLQPLPQRQHSGDRRKRMQLDVVADLRAEGPRVVGNPGRAGQADGAGQVLDLLGQPQPQVHLAGPGIGPGDHLPEQDPGGQRQRCPSGRPGSRTPARRQPPTTRRSTGAAREAGEGGQQVVGRHQVGQPAHAHQDVQGDAHQRLEDLRLQGRGADCPAPGAGPATAFRQGLTGGVDQRADPGVA